LKKAKALMDSLRPSIVLYEMEHVATARAMSTKSTLRDAQTFSMALVDYFDKENALLLAERELKEARSYLAFAEVGDDLGELRARVADESTTSAIAVENLKFLRKYRARRNAIYMLVNSSVTHPDLEIRRKCFRALSALATRPTFGLCVMTRTACLQNCVLTLSDWAANMRGDAPWEVIEVVHTLVCSKPYARSEILNQQLRSPILAAAVLSVLKTVPQSSKESYVQFHGYGIDLLWRLVRGSGYNESFQLALAAEGALRYLLDNRSTAEGHMGTTHALCGCALALATRNAKVQHMMTAKGVKFPRRIIKLLAKFADIDYEGEFSSLNSFLTANSGK
jgi:hypothetical protein